VKLELLGHDADIHFDLIKVQADQAYRQIKAQFTKQSGCPANIASIPIDSFPDIEA